MPENRRKKILVIDDSPEDRKMVRRILEMSDELCAIEVPDAEEALSFCEKVQIDGLCLDLHLPGMSGLEFLVRLESIYGGGVWPVVVLTGEGDEETAVEAMKRGAQDYLPKAELTKEKLLRAVESASARAVEYRQAEIMMEQLRSENERLRQRVAVLDARLSETLGKLAEAESLSQD